MILRRRIEQPSIQKLYCCHLFKSVSLACSALGMMTSREKIVIQTVRLVWRFYFGCFY